MVTGNRPLVGWTAQKGSDSATPGGASDGCTQFMRLVSKPAVFWVISENVDDGLVNGPPPRDEQVLETLGKPPLLKIEAELQTGQQTVYLGRVIENFLQALGLGQSSAVRTPCAKQEFRKEDEKLLPGEWASLVRNCMSILPFIAHDRADAAGATKEMARGMKTPTTGDLTRLKRIGRYESVPVRRAGPTN